MEAIDPGKPLSFLDHHIQCGNSLIGATPRLLREGIPDAAFQPVEGDDKAVCSEYKKRNKQERASGQQSLFGHDLQPWEQLGNLATAMMSLDADDDGSVAAEQRKQERYEELVGSSDYEFGRLLADTWCAAFFWKKTREFDYPITEEVFRRIERTPHWCPDWMKKEVQRLAEQFRFFHWHLAFPDVFRVPARAARPENEQTGWSGGFDCVLGNPPWERVKLQEEEFFASRDLDIANAANKAARQNLIKRLATENPALAEEFAEARRAAENSSSYVRTSGRYPLMGVGDVNTYAIFAELFRSVLAARGRAGIICPTGIATDNTTRAYFDDLTARKCLVSLIGFENEAFIFPGVHHSFKFCALTVAGSRADVQEADLAFLCKYFADVHDKVRHFRLSASDTALLNPNTRTCPVFRTRQDAVLTKAIYRTAPVLVDETAGIDHWGIYYLRLVHLGDHVDYLRDRWQIACESLSDCYCAHLTKDGTTYSAVYEARQIWFYNHRYASYEGVSKAEAFEGKALAPSDTQMRQPDYTVAQRYWVPTTFFRELLNKYDYKRRWLLGYRDVTSSVVERTCVPSVLPFLPATVSLPTLGFAASASAHLLLGNMSSVPFDFVVRNKVGGNHLSFGILKQLPVIAPDAYPDSARASITTRVVELVYSSWDVKPFADDVWKEADDSLREDITRQWEENRTATGGHKWDPPEWAEIDGDGIKLPPFKWDDDRRALLRAELDAYYAKLYGLNRKQLRYILDPHGLSKKELEDILDPWEDPTCSGPHLLPAEPALDFPGETFRVLKNKEEKQFGEYRTRRLVLEAWERLHDQALMPGAYDQRKVGT